MSQLPASNIDPMKQFRERVLEKLRTDIGSMLPDEALAGLVQQAVQDQFFAERRVPQSYGPDKKYPSWFVEEVGKLAEPIIKEYLNAWLSDNHSTIEGAVKEFLSSQNLMLLMLAAMNDKTKGMIWEAAEAFYQRTQRGY